MQSNPVFTPSVLIDFDDPHADTPGSSPRLRHAFGAPRVVLQAHAFSDVRPLLDAVGAHAREGAWCVGYVRYEAAPAFDPAFAVHATTQPLAWFAVYDEALPWPAADVPAPDVVALQWQSLLSRPDFDAALDQLLHGITQGDYYQVNYTSPLRASLANSDTEATTTPLAPSLA